MLILIIGLVFFSGLTSFRFSLLAQKLVPKLVPVMKLLSYCLFYGVHPVSFFYRPDNWFKKPNDLMTGTIFHGTS
jgi:hypothetical protein